jgi:hypothetical protein
MTQKDWKTLLLKVPGAKQAIAHLVQQGHTEQEAEMGGLAVAGLVILLLIVLFNSFIYGAIRTFYQNIWNYAESNPVEATGVGIFSTVIFLALFFQWLRRSADKKQAKAHEERRERHKIDEKRGYLRRGAMGNFEEIFRFYLAEKYPEIEVKSVHVIDTIPRIRFQTRRFNTELGGNVDSNFELFREALLTDTLHVIETTFFLSENIQYVIVDAMMNFINRKAKYYDGVVLSVKAQREVFLKLEIGKVHPFKVLSSFDFRYNDGMEVQPLPEEESKQAGLLEKLKQQAPQLNVRYEKAQTRVDDGWEKPKEVEVVPVPMDTVRDRELSAMPLAQYQDLAVGLLGKLGFDVRKVKKIPGGTLQIQADFSHPILGGSFLILARQYPENAHVHADLVRELDEVTREEACKRGMYLVTGQFTEEAKNIAKKLAVDLVDGKRLAELLDSPAYDARWTIRMVDEKGVEADLSRLSILDFQKEVDLFLKSMSFNVTKIRRVPGGSIIANIEHPHPVTGGKFAVMAKQFPADTRVDAELVSEFAHVMNAEFCQRGILMVPAEYSMEARALSRFSGVELVDRNIWENLRRHRELGG